MIQNYNQYQFTGKEMLKYLLLGMAASVLLGELFYRSIWGVLLLSPLIYLFLRLKKKELIKKRKWDLNKEFRDGILSLSAALEAGYSAENAFEEAYKDLKLIYPENSLILSEFSYIIHQIKMNITVEQAIKNFGERTGVEDILSFSEVFSTAKRTGGDLIKVIKLTSSVICDKIEVKREIITLITAKRLESNIMKAIPIFILAYFQASSPEFLAPLYHNVFGIIVMTVFLGIYLLAYRIIDHMISIEV
jgi:tight adherence protein B